MKIAAVVLLVLVGLGGLGGLGGLARADGKTGLHAYDGQIVISPDTAPSTTAELISYLKANAVADRHYELMKGPPWEVNLVGVLAKDPGAPVTLVFSIATDKTQKPVQSVEVTPKNGLVIVHVVATIAAGFEPRQTYLVRLTSKSTVLARAELKLRD